VKWLHPLSRLKLWHADNQSVKVKPKSINSGNSHSSKSNDNTSNKKRPWCSIHRMFGHTVEQCFKRKEVLSSMDRTSVKPTDSDRNRGNKQYGARPKDSKNSYGQNHPDRLPKPMYSNNPAFQAVVHSGLDPDAPSYYSNPNGSSPLGQANCQSDL